MEIKCGVPQGSILGPLLFLLYINNIAAIPGSHELIMYADDTSVFFANSSKAQLELLTNSYLADLATWLQANKLNLNTKKTKYILFAPKNKRDSTNLVIHFKDEIIEQVHEQKFLGVWFNQELNWNTHVNKLSSELSRSVGCLYKIGNLIPTWLKKNLYYSLFYSRLCYCLLVWGTTSTTNYNSLLTPQKKMLRQLENYKGKIQNLHTAPLFKKYGILKVNQIYHFKLLQLIHKQKLYVTDLSDVTHAHPLRHEHRRPPQTSTNYETQTMEYQVSKALNNIMKTT
uniref:Putative tick transposon n=1 Tax=Ixodes ricinus TaxID=34613 RepID=A0A147BB35_IXORI